MRDDRYRRERACANLAGIPLYVINHSCTVLSALYTAFGETFALSVLNKHQYGLVLLIGTVVLLIVVRRTHRAAALSNAVQTLPTIDPQLVTLLRR